MRGGGRGQKSLKRCLRIIWMLPKPIQPGSICFSSGWGGINPLNANASKPEILANPLADNLKAVNLEVISTEECFESLNKSWLLNGSMVCTKGGPKGTCHGDSGGPLICEGLSYIYYTV